MNRRVLRAVRGVQVRLLPIGWLTLVWVLLWGDLSAGNVVTGALVALVVTSLLPLPVVRLGGRLHLGAAVMFGLRFAADLVRASAEVAVLSLRPGPLPASSVVAIRLRTGSELHMALTAQTISLTPGSLVVDVDPHRSIIYVHLLDAPDDAAVEAFRDHVHMLEAGIIHAVGSRYDLTRLERGRDEEEDR